MSKLMSFIKDEEGQGMVEYGLIIGLVAVAAIALLVTFKGQITSLFGGVTTALPQ